MTFHGPGDSTRKPRSVHRSEPQTHPALAPQWSDRAEEVAVDTVRTHLARFLLSQATNGRRSSRHWTQAEVAAHIGTARDVVGKTLRSLAREGLIRRERGRLVVTDVERLRREAVLR
jgi:hypothetical protein